MKLEVGMYVRTKYNGIFNIQVLETIRNINCDYIEINYIRFPRNEILKASHNIIDLIEVGDYVNGEKVTSIIPPDILGDEELDYAHISSLNGEPLYEDIEIKSIVTKEQFLQMEYKVGE